MSKINSLTSIRFFAAAMIVIGHAGNAPGFELFRIGTVQLNNAVSFFYVLSGFILSFTYYSMDVKRGYVSFLIARLARIWPLHLVMLLVCLFTFGPNIFYDYGKNYADIFSVNLALLQSWVPNHKFYFSYNAVSWSVSTELFFYTMFPILIFLSRKYGNHILLFFVLFPIIISILCTIFSLPLHSENDMFDGYYLLYINPVSRLAEFAFGMYMFRVKEKINESIKNCSAIKELASTLLVVLSVCICGMLYNSWGTGAGEVVFYWLAIAGSFPFIGFLVYMFSRQNGAISVFLSNKYFVYFGEISFSVYMCHQIILNYLRVFHADILKENPVLMYVIYWMVTLLMSSLLYHLVEVPARKVIRGVFAKRQVAA